MSRSGLVDGCDLDPLEYGRWRAQVASTIRGKRGQSTLKEILAALDAMPVKELAANSLVSPEGQYCTLGALGAARSMDMSDIDPDDRESVASAFNITEQLAAEIMYLNDEHIETRKCTEVPICGPVRPHWPDYGRQYVNVWSDDETAGRKRWQFMRDWVSGKIIAN